MMKKNSKKKIDSWLECVHCHEKYDIDQVKYLCKCGGVLSVQRDLTIMDGKFLKNIWNGRWGMKQGIESSGVWRYKELIFDVPDSKIITRQEGNTRMYPAGRAGEYAGLKNLLLK